MALDKPRVNRLLEVEVALGGTLVASNRLQAMLVLATLAPVVILVAVGLDKVKTHLEVR